MQSVRTLRRLQSMSGYIKSEYKLALHEFRTGTLNEERVKGVEYLTDMMMG